MFGFKNSLSKMFYPLAILIIALSIHASAAAQEPTGEPAAEPTAEPTPEQPTQEPTTEPAAESTVEPTTTPTGEPAAEPTAEPTPEQPTQEPTTEPAAEPTAEPTTAPTGEPAAEPTGAPVEEKTTGPTAEPTAEPAAEPAQQQPGNLRPDPNTAVSLESQVESTKKLTPEEAGPDQAAPSSRSAPPESQAAAQFKPVSIVVTFDETVEAQTLEAVSGGRVIHRYERVFNGASLIVPEDNIETVAAVKGVTGVYLDQLLPLETKRSPRFIGADRIWRELDGQEHAGEGVIVGVLDSGIWPEHPSVADPDPFGNPYPPPPVEPGSEGFGSGGPREGCDFGNTAFNPNDAPFTCNNKLIGAYSFIDTYKAVVGLLPTEFDSARDDNGHGTHTATTAAGNGNVRASIFDIPRGRISGIAPRAHIIAYKVCGDQGCYQSDSVAAVEQAILDGVDVINFSIGGGGNPYSDIVEIAFSVAYENGVFVSASAGNSGPAADTVAHRGPWTMTVGASVTDRHFLSTATLVADNGEILRLTGASITPGITRPTPVVDAADFGDALCLENQPDAAFNGQIVVCQVGVISRIQKGFNVMQRGAVGILLYNPTIQGEGSDNHFLPAIHFEYDEGARLLEFLAAHSGVQATFPRGQATRVRGDVMAPFSSRGGPGQTLGISKPDVTAPGVQILAGNTALPATPAGGPAGELFQAIRGTSMSSPHVAGAAALLKDLHPDWTPGQIKSALMTTAKIFRVVAEDGIKADPFDMGSGRIDLRRAGEPGLTFDESAETYRALENRLWDANYPSIYVPAMPGRITLERIARSVVDDDRRYRFGLNTPRDLDIDLPRSIVAPGRERIAFEMTIDARDVPLGETRHGQIFLVSNRNILHMPVTVVRGQAPITLAKVCVPDEFNRSETTTCTVTLENTAFEEAVVRLIDEIPRQLALLPDSLTGAGLFDERVIGFEGVLAGVQPPLINTAVNPTASPAGYLPLADFDGTIDVGATDESIITFNVPSFDYAGESYSQIGVVSNGYIVVGGGTGADIDPINSDLPDPTPPNNILAPFWTDLDPEAGGRVLINVLTDGLDSWLVVEWEAVPNYGDGELNTTQVWIGLNTDANPVEDISFVYGPEVSDGDNGFLTIGAENKFGNSGSTVYFDGTGTPPVPSTMGYEVAVFSTPGAPGETHTITFSMTGVRQGRWKNCAELTSPIFRGVAIACDSGQVR